MATKNQSFNVTDSCTLWYMDGKEYMFAGDDYFEDDREVSSSIIDRDHPEYKNLINSDDMEEGFDVIIEPDEEYHLDDDGTWYHVPDLCYYENAHESYGLSEEEWKDLYFPDDGTISHSLKPPVLGIQEPDTKFVMSLWKMMHNNDVERWLASLQ